MSEQFLNASQICSSLEQVRSKRVPQQVRVDTSRLEPRLLGQAAEDQEGPGPRQRATLRIQEELGTVAPVEERPPAGEVAAERLDGRPADRDDPLLAALAGDAHEALVEVDAGLVEPDGLGDADAGSIEELDEGAVAQRPRRGAVGGSDQARGPAGGERARELAEARRQRELCGRVVVAYAEELQVSEEAPGRRRAARDRRGRETFGAQPGRIALEFLERRPGDGLPEECRQSAEVAPVGVDRSWRAP